MGDLFLRLNAFKRLNKRNFIAKGVVTNNKQSDAAKTKKTPFKIQFFFFLF